MQQGLIKFLNFDRNYGFIAPADGTREIFFHGSVLEDQALETLWEGQQVGYELAPQRQPAEKHPPRASLVRPLRLSSPISIEPTGCTPLARHGRSQAKKPSWRR